MKKDIKEKIIEILDDLIPRKIDLPVKYLNLGDGQDKYISDIADQILAILKQEREKETFKCPRCGKTSIMHEQYH